VFRYSEKQIGYCAVTLLLTENSDLVRLVVNSIKKDLDDNREINNCLALQAVANLGGREIAEALAPSVFKILTASQTVNFPKKKAALCLLRLYRKHPDVVPVAEWSSKIIACLEDYDLVSFRI
jgi:AP-2 complex subunit alpha